MLRQLRICSVLLCCLATLAGADTIKVDGQIHEDVFIRETGALYYVQSPADGSVFVVRKSTVASGDVTLTQDPTARQALQDRWKQAYLEANPQFARVEAARVELTNRVKAEVSSALAPEASSLPEPPRSLSLVGDPQVYAQWRDSVVTNGYVPYINLKNVPMRDALKAVLRQLNLDYKIEGDIVYISSPELLRRESMEELETRYYQLASTANDTLPKIVISHPQFGGGSFNQGGFGSGGVGGGGFGQGGFGQGGFGQGGFGQGGFGQGGFGQGGFGQGGFGNQGGFGGGFGGGMDATAISNISMLFTNIDDRIVGETPAVIGPSFITSSRNTAPRGR